MDAGVWDKFCKIRSLNPWFVSEGLASSDEEVTLTQDEMKQLGLLP